MDRRIGREARESGAAFEAWLEDHHREALRLGIVSGPVEHNEPHGKYIHGEWQMVKPGVADYTGILFNGHGSSLGVEAKKREKILYRREVEPRQGRYLDAVVRGGGLALLLVRFVEDGRETNYAPPWQHVPWTMIKTALSVTPELLAPWVIPAESKCYLDPLCPVRGVPLEVPGRRYPRE